MMQKIGRISGIAGAMMLVLIGVLHAYFYHAIEAEGPTNPSEKELYQLMESTKFSYSMNVVRSMNDIKNGYAHLYTSFNIFIGFLALFVLLGNIERNTKRAMLLLFVVFMPVCILLIATYLAPPAIFMYSIAGFLLLVSLLSLKADKLSDV